jgi:hypothetical protein
MTEENEKCLVWLMPLHIAPEEQKKQSRGKLTTILSE